MARAPLRRAYGALLYDALLIAALELATGFCALPLMAMANRSTDTLAVPGPVARTALFILLVSVAGFYCVYFWTGGRRTLAQKTWHLRVVDDEQRTPTAARALGRYAAIYIGPAMAVIAYLALRETGHRALALSLLGTNWLWPIIDPARRFLHDRVAGTMLADDPAQGVA